MRHIESTDTVTPDMVILAGSAFYRVTDVFPSKVRAQVWEESRKAWGRLIDVPVPSPAHPVHEVPAEEVARCFPMEVK